MKTFLHFPAYESSVNEFYAEEPSEYGRQRSRNDTEKSETQVVCQRFTADLSLAIIKLNKSASRKSVKK